MSSNERLTFPSYLIPSFSFPFRRRQSANGSSSIPTLSYSPTSSSTSTPISSPTSANFPPRSSFDKDHDNDSKTATSYSPLYPSSPLQRSSSPQLIRPCPSTLRCLTCSAHLGYTSQIVSKGFTGRHGRAYLVAPPPPIPTPVIPPFPPNKADKSKNLINTRIGRSVNRELLTGHHVVADVNCKICNSLLGWKYVDAKEAAQRYKIGKFILETKRVAGVENWEDEGTTCMMMGGEGGSGKESTTGEWGRSEGDGVESKEEEQSKGWVVFDSEDEEECEELFAGTWDADVAQRRRVRKVDRRKREASKDSGIGGL